jgi:hypothetical protein
VPTDTIAIARVQLARDLTRLLALPLLLLVVAIGGIGVAILQGGPLGLALVVASGLVILVALLLAAVPLSLRVDVEVGGLRVRWLAGSRRYQLVRGPVTRVGLTGDARGVLRSRHPILGWSNGRATLRGEEAVTLVRLARSVTVILIPTDKGRLAVAAASETDLIEALGAAARVQERLDEVSGRVMAAFASGIPDLEERRLRTGATATAVEPAESAEAVAAGEIAQAEPPPFLTGIERARLEERLAAAREAALIAAEAERRAAQEAAPSGETPGTAARTPAAVMVTAGLDAEAPVTASSLARQRIAGTWTRPAWATDATLRVLVTIGWAGVPLVASIIAWGVTASSDLITSQRQLSLALTLGGPAGALGVLVARTWWPRFTGLVTCGALAGLLLAARAAFG